MQCSQTCHGPFYPPPTFHTLETQKKWETKEEGKGKQQGSNNEKEIQHQREDQKNEQDNGGGLAEKGEEGVRVALCL